MKLAKILAALVLVVVAAGADAKPSNKWRIECNGKSKVDGEIVLSVEPVGGKPIELVVAMPAGTSENAAAVIIRDTIRVPLRETHNVERDDWEDVLVKKRWKQPDFDLILEDNTAQGLRITLDRE